MALLGGGGGYAQMIGQEFAPALDMTDHGLLFALIALKNKLVLRAGVSNTCQGQCS